MGMDVKGVKPKNEEGRWIRFSIWEWRPLALLMEDIASDLFDARNLKGIHYNDGCGLQDDDKCFILADRIEKWLEERPYLNELEYKLVVADDIRVDYKVTVERVKQFIEFLRSCGGFEIW